MSNHEANKVTRVLTGERLKFTARISLPDNRVLEFQTDETPKIEYNDQDRHTWLVGVVKYNNFPIMRWPDGAVLLVEANPEAEK